MLKANAALSDLSAPREVYSSQEFSAQMMAFFGDFRLMMQVLHGGFIPPIYFICLRHDLAALPLKYRAEFYQVMPYHAAAVPLDAG